ncbi:MAG: PEP-CTERM sorting domain-containing protein [Rheinheimera sp.]|nr:MAG: PEP-CTERM sorting domain-containing protein [Rheinheimera sp.]
MIDGAYATNTQNWSWVESVKPNSGPTGYFSSEYGRAFWNDDNSNMAVESSDLSEFDSWPGSLLVRAGSVNANPVSSPSILSLLGLGLVGLVVNRRRKITR